MRRRFLDERHAAARRAGRLLAVCLAGLAPSGAGAEDSAADLAQKLQNPVAALISVPFQSNWDFGIGPEDATRYLLNVQPVIPFSLGDWNLITRTILPILHVEEPVEGVGDETGLGDVVQSFFLSPRDPVQGWIVGAGPVLLYPTATEDVLGSEKWGAGPTAVVLQQRAGWSYGVLANHLWSFAGTDRRDDVSATFLQPFLSYTTKTHTTFGLNTESTYDWEAEQWSVPLNATVTQVLKLGPQPFSLQIGGRHWAERPDGGPDWGLRFAVTLLFPR